MAALLVTLAVMAVLMTAAMPVWRHEAQREKEAELVFRGEQYARAIGLYQRRTGGFPSSIDVLVSQRFLRKKYKDPMMEDGEFQTLTASGLQQGQNPQGGRGAAPGRGGSGQPGAPAGLTAQPGAQGTGGLMGVVSKSKVASIRVYRGGTHYNEWQFIFAGVSGRPGGPGRGGPGMGPGTGSGMGPGMGGPGGMGGRGRGRGQGPDDGRGIGPGGRGQGPGRGFGPGGQGQGSGPGPIIRRGGGGVE